MGNRTMVIMESGSQWPAWLDRKGPSPSSIELIAQKPRETHPQFGRRAAQRLLELDEAPMTAVLVCNAHSGLERMPMRATLARALVGRAQQSGRGHVVLVADGDYTDRRHLMRLAARLNEEIEEHAAVAVRFRAVAREHRELSLSRRVA
ncbi:hypothetical protein ACFL5O_06785 [Myxococcota bacterium]